LLLPRTPSSTWSFLFFSYLLRPPSFLHTCMRSDLAPVPSFDDHACAFNFLFYSYFTPVYYSLDHFGFSLILSQLLLTPFTFSSRFDISDLTLAGQFSFLLLFPSSCFHFIRLPSHPSYLELASRPQLIDHVLHGLRPEIRTKVRILLVSLDLS
jgi:hypothetical protein